MRQIGPGVGISFKLDSDADLGQNPDSGGLQLRLRLLTRDADDVLQSKMEDHVRSVERFHTALATQSSWLAATEKSLRSFKVPSKLLDGVQAQMCSLKVYITLCTVSNICLLSCQLLCLSVEVVLPL